MPKVSGARNYFSVLGDSDEPARASILKPSLLSMAAAADDLDDLAPQPGAAAAAAAPPPSAKPLFGGGAGSSSGIDLSAVADEIFEAEKNRPATAKESAWDFSSLATTAESEVARVAAAAADEQAAKRKAIEEQMLRFRSAEKDIIEDKMRKADYSHKQRVRRLAELQKATASADRLGVKLARKQAAAKARNKAKNS